MNAMMLAAGKGERIRGISKDRPKVLLEVCGKTLLEHNLRLLRRWGIRKIVINTHYKATDVRDFLRSNGNFGLKIILSHEKRILGTAGGVKKAERYFKRGPFLVLYGDNLTDFDIGKLRQSHLRSKAIATLGVFDPSKTKHSGILAGQVERKRNGRVTGFKEKRGARRRANGGFVNAGVLMLAPEILKWIPSGTCFDFSRDLFPLLIERGEKIWSDSHVSAVLASDTPEAYKRTCRLAEALL